MPEGAHEAFGRLRDVARREGRALHRACTPRLGRPVVLAVPVAPAEAIESFFAVDALYGDFEQTGDEAVVQLLEDARRQGSEPTG